MSHDPLRGQRDIRKGAQEMVSASASVKDIIRLQRSLEDRIKLADSVQAAVGQAQAQIAGTLGEADDATTRIEELSAAALTPREKELAEQFAVINQTQKAVGRDLADVLPDILDAVKGLRSDQAEDGKVARRWNLVFLLIAAVSLIVAVVAVFKPA